MKLRALQLSNIRRFAGQRATIEAIGDGITVLSEPNEFGKSTFFDALHALFFEPHRTTGARIKALQPHSGGAPEVEATLDLPEGRFHLSKRWLSRARAQLRDDTGRILAQDDEAEAWIRQLMGQGLAGQGLAGPSGLLWVRQGLLGMEPEGSSAAEKTERSEALAARRDLLSSVSGEIERMTGGRRMEAVLARVAQDLGRLATSRLKPKTDGDWHRAVEEAQSLARQREDLEQKAARLSTELAARERARRELQRLAAPEAEAQRRADLAAARQALADAQAHADRIEVLRRDSRLADLTLAQSEAEIARLTRLSQALTRAEAEVSDAAAQAQRAEDSLAALHLAEQAAAQALATAETRRQSLRQAELAAQKAKTAAAARLRAQALRQSLAEADRQRDRIDAARAARALIAVTAKGLEEVEAAQALCDRLALRISSQAAVLSFAYDGAARVLCQGQEVAPGPLHVTTATVFDLPGLGRLQVDPGEGTSAAAPELALAQARLRDLLRLCGAADLAEARRALALARDQDEAIRTAEAVLQGIAPKGHDAVRQDLALAEAEAGAAPEIPPEAPLEALAEAELAAALAEAEAADSAARSQLETARIRLRAAGEARAAAQADALSAARRHEQAQAEAGPPEELALRLADLLAGLAPLRAASLAQTAELQALIAAAPDLQTAAARLSRAESVEAQARQTRETLQNDLSRLDGSIGALADQGIEEALEEVRGRLAAAEARAQRYEAEVLALDRLRRALEAARSAARDAYFGPVLRELKPLLGILQPGAELLIDDQSLLPAALTRGGLEERLEILSGGTREQLAILTRLAFARLFAQAGRAVPIILDDALVHSDDERIEAMFTALHRIARDQQILVLTCRHRAFASLGGERARVRIETL